MKTVCKKDGCTGCMACKDICPKNAIDIDDSLRAYNAVIDEDKCINCDACHGVCQINHSVPLHRPIEWRQGWAKDSAIRSNSSSGGLATAIEKSFVKNGGIVCSCVFQGGSFCFAMADNANDVDKFSGSKYIKSNPSGCYKEIKKRLIEGKKVLFVGLPCQVGAVKKFVGDKLSVNLYTIDLICHGSPDPKILKCFLSQYEIDLSKLESISFRTKTSFQLKENYKPVAMQGALDKYSIAFLNSICYTENCYECQYARIERVSDITLGDSWGSNLPDSEQKKGISLILCQSEKGQALLNSTELELKEVNIEQAVHNNHQLRAPSHKPDKRDFFMQQLEKGKKFNDVVQSCYPKTCFKQLIKGVLVKGKILGGGG